MTADRPVRELDGANFVDLESFYDEVSRVLVPGAWWGRNLDAFNDILCFRTPEGVVAYVVVRVDVIVSVIESRPDRGATDSSSTAFEPPHRRESFVHTPPRCLAESTARRV